MICIFGENSREMLGSRIVFPPASIVGKIVEITLFVVKISNPLYLSINVAGTRLVFSAGARIYLWFHVLVLQRCLDRIYTKDLCRVTKQ